MRVFEAFVQYDPQPWDRSLPTRYDTYAELLAMHTHSYLAVAVDRSQLLNNNLQTYSNTLV
jgi:hypothetical protein